MALVMRSLFFMIGRLRSILCSHPMFIHLQ